MSWRKINLHRIKMILMVAFIFGGVLATAGAANATPSFGGPPFAPPGLKALVCSNGSISSGNYASITVRGTCSPATNAVIRVVGNLDVAPGATLDAQDVPSTITVGQNVTAASGSLLELGCLPGPNPNLGYPCTVDPSESSNITVNGNVVAIGAFFVALRGITVRGSVVLIGGGEHTTDGSNNWPIKLSTIGGNVIVHGATPDWVGVVANTIRGNVILTNITIDTGPTPPAENINVGSNTIGRNLICFGLAPAVNEGFGTPNVIGGKAIGQCANLQLATP
jgi:hypothetical protein